jgi:hypothetical protein
MAFDREIELSKFKAYGVTPEELGSVLEMVSKGQQGADVKVKEMLERKEEAFVPDCSKESIFKYSAVIGDHFQPQMDLYKLLSVKGPYYAGGENPSLLHKSFLFFP